MKLVSGDFDNGPVNQCFVNKITFCFDSKRTEQLNKCKIRFTNVVKV